jgi:hypothetical protein
MVTREAGHMADKSFTQSYIGGGNGYLLLLYILGFKAFREHNIDELGWGTLDASKTLIQKTKPVCPYVNPLGAD